MPCVWVIEEHPSLQVSGARPPLNSQQIVSAAHPPNPDNLCGSIAGALHYVLRSHHCALVLSLKLHGRR